MILSNSQNCEKVTPDIVADKTDFVDDENCNDVDAGKCTVERIDCKSY